MLDVSRGCGGAFVCARGNAERLGVADVTEFRAGHMFGVHADVVLADVSGSRARLQR